MINKIVVVLVICIVAGFATYVIFLTASNQVEEQTLLPTVTPTVEDGTSQDEVDEERVEPGTIRGSLSYPSEGLPDDMEVCVEDVSTGEPECTTDRIDLDAPSGEGYELQVLPGTYYVYAHIPDDEYRAYYSEFVVCGLRVDCDSHDPIPVIVESGETVEGIDPHDWYATEE